MGSSSRKQDSKPIDLRVMGIGRPNSSNGPLGTSVSKATLTFNSWSLDPYIVTLGHTALCNGGGFRGFAAHAFLSL